MASETIMLFYCLSLFISVVIGTVGLRGVLEAYQGFHFVNEIRIPMSIFTFLGPLLIMSCSKSLIGVNAVLAVGRATTCPFTCAKMREMPG